MMKLHLILALWAALSQAYVSRMAVVSRLRPGPAALRPAPAALRPGVVLQRPWMPRIGQAAPHPHRPYVVYRHHNPQNKYPVKQYTPTRTVYSAPWRATRPVATTERQLIRAAAGISHNGGSGGIHTIPAPNLSLKEKPIVVVDASSEKPKIFEVTEKHPESSIYQMAKIEQPIGFSKAASISGTDIQHLIRNGASFQLALSPDSGFSSISVPQPAQFQPAQTQSAQFQHAQTQPAQFQHDQIQPAQFQHGHIQLAHFQHSPIQPAQFQQTLPQPAQFQELVQHSVNQPLQQQHPLLPQQFSVQQINTNSQEMVQARPEGIVISPSALYQPDPAFLQKLQNQLLQRFPGIEFVPYVTEFTAPIPHEGPSQVEQGQVKQQGQLQAQESRIQVQTVLSPLASPPPSQNTEQTQKQQQSQTQSQPQEQPTQAPQSTPVALLQNEQITKQTPSSFVPSEFHRNIVQRGTPEGTVTLSPVTSHLNNVTENKAEVSTVMQPQNITEEPKLAEPQGTTTMYIQETSTADSKTTPIYYAQVGQSVGNIIASGIYSAINDVRAAVASQEEYIQNMTKSQESIDETNTSTTTVNNLSTINPDLQPYFVRNGNKDGLNTTANEIQPVLGAPFKPQDSTVAYSLVRADDKENKITSDGSIYAGQLVEASVSEDHDFNMAKAKFPSRRAPIRLVARAENKEHTTNNTNTKGPVVKARIPPRSKLTFDDKTGEPVLRIYASYVDVNSQHQKDMLNSKLASSKRVREAVYRKQDPVDWKDKAQGGEQFGLKLRSRSDDYMPLFDDYQD